MENMADALGLKFQSIPFSGDAAILPTLMKGDIDFSASGISTIRGQNFRALAVFAAKRHPAYPDAPTERELGVPVSVPPGHNGLYAPKGLPGDVHGALERGCAEVTKSEAVSRAMENTGQSITYLGSRDFYAQTVADYTFKGELIRRLGLATP
jgi:tripartite-type tricarboxylate transporter receptor subunit TctC